MSVQIISEEAKAKLRLLLAARDAVDQLESQLKDAKRECDEVEMDVFDMFSAEDDDGNPVITGTLSVPLGEPYGTVKFRTRETHYAKIVDDDKLKEYYTEQGELDTAMTAPKWVMKEVNSDVRTAIDNGTSLPPGTTYRTDRGMTVTRQKG